MVLNKSVVNTALIVGTQSGCGKTTIMLALLQALKNKQHTIQAFKAGPDYLDPFWHQVITARPCYNLDTKMMGEEGCIKQFNQQASTADIALIEGAMGLFDGAMGVGERGSSANLAAILKISVILVVDVKGMSGSIVPLVSGFCDYAHPLKFTISAIIANRVGSQHHADLLADLLTNHHLPPLLGWMQKNAPTLPERHLGLKRPEETNSPDFSNFFHWNEQQLSQALSPITPRINAMVVDKPLLIGKTIAIAQDAACCFIYPSNITWLHAQGANVHFFSVIKGEFIPEQADGVWLPGGYPELYAHALAHSASLASISNFIQANKPVLAECGGAMLLGKNLIDLAGESWPMAAILPYTSVMKNRLVGLGYREEASGVRGHEFHHSQRINDEDLPACFNLNRGDKGLRYKNLRASYIHWYFPSASPIVAGWLS
jgi:cobyrinic acid a,c-diamide synthase